MGEVETEKRIELVNQILQKLYQDHKISYEVAIDYLEQFISNKLNLDS